MPRPPFNRGGPPPPRDEHRINDRIRVPRVKVVDEAGAMLGEMPTEQARQIARERGFDLVEVAAEARPPVCKLLDYGKYKYEQKKKSHKSKVHQHVQKVKEVRLRPRTDDHDLMTKLKKAREFLEEGDKILITIFFRGREMAHKETGRAMMDKIKKELAEVSKIEHDISMFGPRMQVTLLPKPGMKLKPKRGGADEDEAEDEAGAEAAPAAPPPAAPPPAAAPQGGTNA